MRKVTIDNETLLQAQQALQNLGQQGTAGLSTQEALDLRKSKKGIEEAAEPVREQLNEILEDTAKTDGEGEKIRTSQGYLPDPDRIEERNDRIEELHAVETEVKIGKAVSIERIRSLDDDGEPKREMTLDGIGALIDLGVAYKEGGDDEDEDEED